jgi:hypothetical protein
LGERLVTPAGELTAGRKRAALARGAAGQLHQINHLVQNGARLFRVVLEHEGGREVRQDHRLVLLLARTQPPRGVLERCLGTREVLQAKLASTDESTELLPAKDPEHWVIGRDLRQVEVGPL